MIHNISFKKDSIFGERNFDIKPLTITVGNNGSGKTTLLDSLMNFKEERTYVKHCSMDKGEVCYYWFDTYKHSPRHQDSQYASSESFLCTVMSHFQSHGESLLPSILMCDGKSDSIFFMDEPECGISLKNQYKIVKKIKSSLKKNNQLIIATHSYVIIQQFPEVLNLDIGEWQPSKDYLNSQLKG